MPFNIDENGLTINSEDTFIGLSGDDVCLAYSWEEPNINNVLKKIAGNLSDKSPPTKSAVTLRAILDEPAETEKTPIKEFRLDWLTEGPERTFDLPGLSVTTPDSPQFTLIMGRGDTPLTNVTLALTLPRGSDFTIATNFAWGRDGDREFQNDDEREPEAPPLIEAKITAEPNSASDNDHISLVLLDFDVAQIDELPTFFKQLDTVFTQLDLSDPEALCTPTPDLTMSALKGDDWSGQLTLNLPFGEDQNNGQQKNQPFTFPFLKQDKEGFLQCIRLDGLGATNVFNLNFDDDSVQVTFTVEATVCLGPFELETGFDFTFDFDQFALNVNHSGGIEMFASAEQLPESGPKEYLGLNWSLRGQRVEEGKYHLFTLVTKDNNFQIVQAEGAVFELGYAGISDEEIKFSITNFAVTPNGLNLTTTVVDAPVKLKGLNTKFRFHDSGFEIVENQIKAFTLAGTGPLPPALVGDATASIFLQFDRENNGNLMLIDGKAELKGDKLLHCQGTRFQFSIDAIGLKFVSDGKFHLYFTLTGSAKFVLAPGDDKEGALALLPNIQIDLIECPLTDDVSVIGKHVKFLIELPKPISFNFLGAFEMELRAIGFVPQADVFDGDGAMQVTGQLKFAQGAGDVADNRVDYHKLLIGLPEKGSFIPRIHFQNLPINLNVGEAFRLNGVVDFVDDLQEKGFTGEGMLEIQGLPTIAASFAFLRVRRDETSPWLRAWFIYLEVRKVSFMIPVVQLYIREVGLGFGYRYTIASIKVADQTNDVKELLAQLSALSRTQGDLSKRDRWAVDLEERGEDPRWTIVLRALISQTSVSSPLHYNEQGEEVLKCLFLFDAIIAFRSDLTFFMAARGWINTNYNDFISDDSIRERPIVSGFVLLSPRQKRFLAHVKSNFGGHLGSRPEIPAFVQEAIKGSSFSATLLIEPGLLHFELGWPNMMAWIGQIGPLKTEQRGGFIFRISGREMVVGINYLSRGSLSINVGFDAGIVGVSISAHASVAYGARLIGVLDFREPTGQSAIYGAIGFELRVEISIKFWIQFLFFKAKFNFSLSIGLTASLEVGFYGLALPGIRGKGTISLSAMGHSLNFSVSIGLNEGQVTKALERTEGFLDIGLEATDVEAVPGLGDDTTSTNTANTDAVVFGLSDAMSPTALDTLASRRMPRTTAASTGGVSLDEASLSDTSSDLAAPDYIAFVIREVSDDEFCYFVLMPQSQQESSNGHNGFLPVPPANGITPTSDFRLELDTNATQPLNLEQFDPSSGDWTPQSIQAGEHLDWTVNWNAAIVQGAERRDEANPDMVIEDNVEITLREYLGFAFLETDQGLQEPNPINAAEEEMVPDDRVHNPTDSAFDAAVRGAVEQFRGSPYFKQDPNHGYSQAMAAAFKPETSVYIAGDLPDDETSLEEREQALQEAEVSQQIHQVRGMVYHDLVSDLRTYVETPATERTTPQDSIPFQMGLVFRVPRKNRPAWLDQIPEDINELPKIYQRTAQDSQAISTDAPRQVSTFNVDGTSFRVNSPQFDQVVHYGDADTIAITWNLTWERPPAARCTRCQAEPEHHLMHYHVRRQPLDSREREAVFTVKAAEVLHLEKNGAGNILKRLQPRFQVVDHFSHETLEEVAALPAEGRKYLYTITPVDFEGNRGRPLTVVASRKPNQPPQVPADAELTVAYSLGTSDFTPPETANVEQPDVIIPSTVSLRWTEPRQGVTGGRTGPEIGIGQYRLIFRQETVLPIGSYGLDSATQRSNAKSLPSSNARPLPTDIKVEIEAQGSRDNRSAQVSISALQNAGVFPIGDTPGWRPQSWRIYIQTISINGVPSALAPVGLLLQVNMATSTDPTAIESRQPAELEWLPQPIQLPLLPPEDQRATPGTAHFPMPSPDAWQFNGSQSQITYQPHPADIRCIRFRWNQSPSHLPDYPRDLNAGYHLLELDVDAHTETTFNEADRLARALRQFQEVQMLPAEDLLLQPNNTLVTNQWEAWYPSAMLRRIPQTTDRAQGSQIPIGPWYSWRESILVWPPWPDLADPAFIRTEMFHPDLMALIRTLQDGFNLDENETQKFTVDLQAGPPIQPMTLERFLENTAPDSDPYGWGVLQRFGLSATLSLRDPDLGTLITGDTLLTAIKDAINATEFNDNVLDFLHVELLVQPSQSVDLTEDTPFVNDGLLGLVQISLRPRPVPMRHYSQIEISGPAGARLDLRFTLITPVTLINQADPASGEVILKPEFDNENKPIPAQFSFTVPLNGQVAVLMRSDVPISGDSNTEGNQVSIVYALNPAHTLEFNLDNFFTYQSDPTPHLIFSQSPDGITDADIEALLATHPKDDDKKTVRTIMAAITALHVTFPTEFQATNERSTYFTAPVDTLLQEFSAITSAIGKQWQQFKHYAQSLNSSEPDVDKISVPAKLDLDNGDHVTLTAKILTWTQRFFDHGPNTISAFTVDEQPNGPWLATAYPRAGTPAYAAPDEMGRLKYDHLLEDKWGHIYRYYIRPFGRYDLLWQSLRQSPTLFPEETDLPDPVPVATPAPEAGGLDVVLERTFPVEMPLILRSGRLDGPSTPANPAVPGRRWEVIVAKHPEQTLIERNQTLARQLGFRQVAFTLLRRFAYEDWVETLSTLSDSTSESIIEISHIENETKGIPGDYPDQPDHLIIDGQAEDLDADDVRSIALPERVANFQQGALALQWEGLPFFYEHRLMLVAQTTAKVSPINSVTQRDFEYLAPEPSALASGGESADRIRIRQLYIPLKTLWDSLPPSAQAQWPDENPADPANTERTGRVPGALPDPEVVYQIIERFRGNVEVQAELFFNEASIDPETGETVPASYRFRQLGRRFLVNNLAFDAATSSTDPFALKVDLLQITEIPLAEGHDLPNFNPDRAPRSNLSFKPNSHLLLMEGVLTQEELTQLLASGTFTNDEKAVIQETFDDWTTQMPVSSQVALPESLHHATSFKNITNCHLVWYGSLSMEAADQLRALTGDAPFKDAINRLIEAANDPEASEFISEFAPLGPQQQPRDLSPDYSIQVDQNTKAVSWIGIANEAQLTLLSNNEVTTYITLRWQGLLFDDEKARLAPALALWARIPALQNAVTELFDTLDQRVITKALPVRPTNETLPEGLKGRLHITDTLLHWSGDAPTADEQAVLTALPGDMPFTHSVGDLILQLTNDTQTAIDDEAQPPESFDPAIEGRLIVEDSSLIWRGPIPTEVEVAALNALLNSPELDARYKQALGQLIADLDNQRQVSLSSFSRPTQQPEERSPLLAQLTVKEDQVSWQGRLVSQEQRDELESYALSEGHGDPELMDAIMAIIQDLTAQPIDVDLTLPMRPQPEDLHPTLAERLVIGRQNITYHGLMTADEARLLRDQFSLGADRRTIQRLYHTSLQGGLRDRQLLMRTRRGSAKPSAMQPIDTEKIL